MAPVRTPPSPGRTEALLDTGLEYRPGDPIRVRIVHREHRATVTDDGGATARAGKPRAWREVAVRLERELDVNVSRQGAVSLPVLAAGPSETEVVARIAAASLALYEDLLELAG
jgi:hypothetical protein